MIVVALALLGLATILTVVGLVEGTIWLLAVATAMSLAAGVLAVLRDRWP